MSEEQDTGYKKFVNIETKLSFITQQHDDNNNEDEGAVVDDDTRAPITRTSLSNEGENDVDEGEQNNQNVTGNRKETIPEEEEKTKQLNTDKLIDNESSSCHLNTIKDDNKEKEQTKKDNITTNDNDAKNKRKKDIEKTRKKWTTKTKKSNSTTNNNNNDCKLIGYEYLEEIKKLSKSQDTAKKQIKFKAWELSLYERQLLTKECKKTQTNKNYKRKSCISAQPLYYRYEGIGCNRILIISNYDIGNEDYMTLLQSFKIDDTKTIELEIDTITPNVGMLYKICKSIGGLQITTNTTTNDQYGEQYHHPSTMVTITKIDKVTESDKIIYKKLLENYRNDPTQNEPIKMPKTLTNIHRKYIHDLCNNIGLKSQSHGSKKHNDRYIEISKPEKMNKASQKNKSKTGNNDIFPLLVLGQDVDITLKQHVDLYPFNEKIDTHTPALKPYNVKNNMKEKIKRNINTHKKSYIPKDQSELTYKQKQIYNQRIQLPIYQYRSQIISSIENNIITIIIGDTGCGKSTQVPQYILENAPSNSNIIVTQPRRISTIMLSQRISHEKYDTNDNLIAYQIRLESNVSTNTRITFMTPGILLKKLQHNDISEEYTHIVLDEVHERDRFTEFVMICLRDLILKKKKINLKVILMSATMQVNELVNYWNNAFLDNINDHDDDADTMMENNLIVPIHVPGRMFPVQEYFLEDILKYTDYMDEYILPQEYDTTTQENKKTTYKCLLCNNIEFYSSLELATHLASCTGNSCSINDNNNNLDNTLRSYKKLEQQILNYNHSFNETTTDKRKDNNQLSVTASIFSPSSNIQEEKDKLSATATIFSPSSSIQEKEEIKEGNNDDDDDDDDDNNNTFSSSTLTNNNTQSTTNNTTLEEEELLKKYEEIYDNNNNEYEINYDLIISILHYILSTTNKQQNNDNNGAILIFLPGWNEIMELSSMLYNTTPFNNKQYYNVLPLHSSISNYDQRLVFEKNTKKRKIILSTNIAETSLTIEDVIYVIDSGLVKEKNYDPYLKMNTLTTQYISQSSAKQRMGRAGRVKPGICFKLYSKQRYYKLFNPYLESELLRTSLEEVCLLIKLLHLTPDDDNINSNNNYDNNNIQGFLSKALSPPNTLSIQNAIHTLIDLEAMVPNETNDLTTLGYCLAQLSLEPRVGKMVLWSYLLGCADPTCSMAVTMSLKSPFVLPKNNQLRKEANDAILKLSYNSESDLITFIHLVRQVSTFYNTRDDDQDEFYNNRRKKQSYNKQQNLKNFCSDYFLNYPTVKMIMSLRNLLSQELQKLGFEDPIHNNNGSGKKNNNNNDCTSHHNRCHKEAHKEYAILQATIAAGLYPNIAYRRRKELHFTTYASTLGYNKSKAKISVGSVNAIRSENVPLSTKCMTDYEFLIFGEILRGSGNNTFSSSNFQLSQTTFLASPLSLFLLCGNKLEVIDQEQGRQRQQQSSNTLKNDDDDNDSNNDNEETPSRYSHLTILSLDDWIQFYTYKDTATSIYILRHRLKNVFQHFVENRVMDNSNSGSKRWVMSKVDEDALKTLDIVLRSAHNYVCNNG